MPPLAVRLPDDDKLRSIYLAVIVEPVALWVWGSSAQWAENRHLAVFVDFLVQCGLHPIFHRWRFLQSKARKRVWARTRFIPRSLRYSRTPEGEVARALYAFTMWQRKLVEDISAFSPLEQPQWPLLMLCPPCRNCGTPTGRWCESCHLYGRQARWERALCTVCDGPAEAACVHCLRDVYGTVVKV